MNQTSTRLALVAFCTTVTLVAPASSATAGAAVQVTKAEYGKVAKSMSATRVKNIVGAKGKIIEETDSCVVRKYRGWGGRDIRFEFNEDADGTPRVVEKWKSNPAFPGGPEIPPSCPLPM